MKPKTVSRSLLLTLGLAAHSAHHAHAASATWDGSESALWSNADNWSAAVPGTGDTATFNASTPNNTISSVGTIILSSIQFDTGAAAYIFQTGTITLNAGGGLTMNSGVTNTQTFQNTVGLRLGDSNGNQSFNITNNSTTHALNWGNGSINSSTTGTKTLTVGGAGSISISGTISNGSGTVALNKVGSGTLTFSNFAQSYTGATDITGGRILVNASGSISGTSGITATNSTLEVNYSNISVTPKLGGAAPLTLRGGSYLQTGRGAATSSTAETIGALTLDTGANIITLTQSVQTGTTSTLTASSLVRNNNATAFVRGGNALGTLAAGSNGATFLAITASPTADLIGGSGTYASGTATDIKIVPYFVGDSGASGSTLPTFLGYDTGNNSFRTLKSGEYLPSFVGAGATSNIRLSGTGTAVGVTAGTYNSMILDAATATGTVTYTLGGTLTLNSGALLVSRSTGTARQAIITGGLLQFAASDVAGTSRQEGIISNFIGNDLRIDSQISGSGGLTLSTFTNTTASTITLNSTSNNYTGTTTVNGTVRLGQAGVVPNGSGVSVGHGGVFDLNGNSEVIDALTGAGTVNTTAATNLATLTVGSNSGGGTFSGIIQNTGASGAAIAVVKAGTGTQTFTGANTYTGGTTLNQGTLTVGTGGTLGASTGALSVNNTNTAAAGTNAVLNLATGVNTAVGTLSGSIDPPNSGTNTATINTQTGRNFSVTQTANATYAGVIAGAGSFTLAAGSTHALTLTGANNYTGNTTVAAGSLIVNGSTSTSIVTVGQNGALGGSGTIGGNTTVAGSLNPGNSPGVLTFSGDLELQSTATTTMEIAGATRDTQYDGIDVGGILTYGGALVLDLQTTFGSGNYTFNLFDFAFGSEVGSFSTVSLSGNYSGSFVNNAGIWNISTNVSGGETWTFNQSTGDLGLTVIPEPHVALLAGLGVLVLLRRRR